jgi:putative membrane protein
MIIRERNVFNTIFSTTGHILPSITPQIVFAAFMGIAAVVINKYGTGKHPIVLTYSTLAFYGIALSTFLGFKNSAAYARWWEAREQWGAQITAVRNLGKLLRSLCPQGHPEVVKCASAHSHAMRFQYAENLNAEKDFRAFLTEEEQAFVCQNTINPNVADNKLYLASEAICGLNKSDPPVIDNYGVVAIQQQISCLGRVQGACDRLVSTPIPFTYSRLIFRTTFIFVSVAPFSMVADEEWSTPGIVACIAYMFFGLEELTHRLERPFSSRYPISMPLEASRRY